MHKKTFLLLSSLLLYALAYGQSATPSVIGSDGEILNAGAFSVEYTVGETVIETITAGGLVLSQGFHQPNVMIVNVEDQLRDLDVEVFPNPTADFVTVRQSGVTEPYRWQLTDARGRSLGRSTSIVENVTTRIDLTPFPAGTYWLRLRSEDRRAGKTLRLIKIK